MYEIVGYFVMNGCTGVQGIIQHSNYKLLVLKGQADDVIIIHIEITFYVI